MWFDGFAWVFCCCYSFFWNVSCGQELHFCAIPLHLRLENYTKNTTQAYKVILKITSRLVSGDI